MISSRYFFRTAPLLLFALSIVCTGPPLIMAQEELPRIEQAAPQSETEALKHILLARKSLQEELHETGKTLKQAKTEEEKAALQKNVEELSKRIQALEKDFKHIATGIDISQFDVAPEKIDWQKELETLFAPIIDGLKKMTARPRELELLRHQVDQAKKRSALAESAVQHINKKLESVESALVEKELHALHQSWQRRNKELQSRLATVKQQLVEKEQEEGMIFSSLKEAFSHRGVDLLLACLVFVSILLLLNYAKQQLYRKTGLGRLGPHRSFLLRLGEISYNLFTILCSVSAFLLVLYLSEDWIMLTLSLFLLFGLAWAGKQALPVFWEQVTMLLNLSTVREGERIMYQGLPWRVLPINIYTKLHNPDLKGGMIRVPISSLIGLQSRPFYKDEPWFPTRTGDFVELADGAFGTVMLQTPEQVILETRYSCLKTYPTKNFLNLNPINYSVNMFGVFVTFGVDYACQPDIAETVPRLMREHIAAALAQQDYGADLLELIVEFKEAAGSSLNLLLAVKFAGGQAANYFAIARFLQRTAVEACNKHGWTIPFMQVTLHQAKPESCAVPQSAAANCES